MRQIQYYFSRLPYEHRHIVGKFFYRIKRHRRIATHYEKLTTTFLGFVCFAAIIGWTNFKV